MSLAADSPVSSSDEDSAAYLDAELDYMSSGSSPRGLEEEEEEEHGQEAAAESESKSDIESKRIKRAKLEELKSVQDSMGSTSCRSREMKLEASSSKNICTHPGSSGDMCTVCGQRLNEKSGVTFRCIHKEFRLGNDEIVHLCNTDMKNLLCQKRLYLVLDLDHTLLNSTQLMHLTSEEEYLKGRADSLSDAYEGSLFMLDFMHLMTKLRPYVHTFLQEVSQIFEMYIYTMGKRAYALEMAKLLDPKREYFGHRIMSCDSGTQRHQKGLDVVLGQKSAVLILDDADNLSSIWLQLRSLSELKSDESKSDGALSSILKVPKNTHCIFFNVLTYNLDGRDVQQVSTKNCS